MSELYGITVSTNYADLLGLIIDQNQKFFTKWYIITAKEDTKTLDVIKNANYEHIEVLFFDFKKGGAKFNKGGALQMAQKLVMANHGEGVNVLIVDSDIYLPDEFGKIYSELTVEPDKLYGFSNRLDYYKYSDFIERKNYHLHPAANEFIGCFNLFKQTPKKLYYESDNCAECDFTFRDLFLITGRPVINWEKMNIIDDIKRIEYYSTNNCIYLSLTIYHLGHCNTHWNGRDAKDDFIIDTTLTNVNSNIFIGKHLNIYTKSNNILSTKFICKCSFKENGEVMIKFPKHFNTGKYEIISNYMCKIKFYSKELICMILNKTSATGQLLSHIYIYDPAYNLEYTGKFVTV